MSEELDYFIYLKATLTANPNILKFNILREIFFGEEGLFRYKIFYANGNVLEAYQKFQIQSRKIIPIRYSFHLQDRNSNLITRWDNAPHHPELENFPYHIHETEDKVISGKLISFEEVLSLVDRDHSF